MGLFNNVDSGKNVAPEKDQVKGQRQAPLDSGIYGLNIKYAYSHVAKSGAAGINLVLETIDKRVIKVTEYIASGNTKGNKTYYEKKQDDGSMKQFPLPGFSIMDSLSRLVAGKGILECSSEKKTIKLYDFQAKQEQPTEVDMIMDLVGKPVFACVLHTIEDQTSKNDATGEYEPNGKTRDKNTVDKFLDAESRRTSAELAANIDSAFAASWETQWNGKINDESTEVKGAGLKGAPAASGANAPKEKLFG